MPGRVGRPDTKLDYWARVGREVTAHQSVARRVARFVQGVAVDGPRWPSWTPAGLIGP